MERTAAPIQNLDAFDITGTRKDGGLDLVICCSGPLDSSTATLELIERKVMGYLNTIAHPDFPRIYPAAAVGPIRIFVSCSYHISDAACELIDKLGAAASKQGVSLLVVKSMAGRSN
jgi:hypothetical protein